MLESSPAAIVIPIQPDFSAERAAMRACAGPVAGVDEVGRGPLAGPVVAAAVVLNPRSIPKGLADSKTLTRDRREALYEAIMLRALSVGVGAASSVEIDRINIRQATFLAMRRALGALSLTPARALIDGRDAPEDLRCPATAIVKGDARSLSIAAASIIAKVTRDRLMTRLSSHYPLYGFERHAGYAVPEHQRALDAHGPCPYHRFSFAPIAERANARAIAG